MTPEVKEFMESMGFDFSPYVWAWHGHVVPGDHATTEMRIDCATATFFYRQFRLRELRARRDEAGQHCCSSAAYIADLNNQIAQEEKELK